VQRFAIVGGVGCEDSTRPASILARNLDPSAPMTYYSLSGRLAACESLPLAQPPRHVVLSCSGMICGLGEVVRGRVGSQVWSPNCAWTRSPSAAALLSDCGTKSLQAGSALKGSADLPD
jgi:hypothetical protein